MASGEKRVAFPAQLQERGTIHTGLIRDGSLEAEAVAATVPESRDLGPTERRRALNYRAGDVVTFRRNHPKKGVATATGYRVAEVDARPCS